MVVDASAKAERIVPENTSHWITVPKKQFVTGLIAIVPVVVVLLMIVWVFATIDNLLQPIIEAIAGHPITGLGFAIMLVMVYGTGSLIGKHFGERMYRASDRALARVPVFSPIYLGLKQIMQTIAGESRISFRQAVLIEFPRPGLKSIAFITNELVDESGRELYVVYVPTSPNPLSGFVHIVNEQELIKTDLGVDWALRMILSGGMLAPDKCKLFSAEDSVFKCK